MVQVSGVFGAGVENGWGPAPLEGVGGRFAVQVPLPKTHLRQGSLGPAPRKPGTCVGVPGIGAQPQPEIRGACQCAPEAPVRPNPMLRQPKLPRGASRCATEGRASRPESLVALGASSLPVAKQAHRKHFPALCVYGRGAPLADIGTWRTATPNLARRTGPPVRHFGEKP